MWSFIARRLLTVIPVLFLVSIGVFLLQALVPGDPAVQVAGDQATPEQIAQVRHDLHLDRPIVDRYVNWARDAVRGDLGSSIYSNASVKDQIASRFPTTLSLVLASVVIAVVVGLPLGAFAAVFPNGIIDRISRGVSSLGVAIPSFVLGLLLIVVVSVRLRWLPPLGYTAIAQDPGEWVRHILLPAATLGALLMAIFSRQLKASLSDAMESNYIRSAFAHGTSRSVVIWKHGLKNSMIPAVTVLAVQTGALLGGTVIVEQMFSIPGIGPYVLDAIRRGDYPVIQGVALVFALSQMLIGLLLDVSYGLLNPRVRVS